TLAGLMAYPDPPDAHADAAYIDLLGQLGLERLTDRLHEFAPWSRTLSPGEQQRIAAARAILAAPDFLFVDEATSALDPELEASLYGLLAEHLPGAALISVAHRPAVARFHDTAIRLEDGRTRRIKLDPAQA
ncbi:ABC transporter ATP-binding protein, partial [Caulobacter radicis]|uniref:ATP-binding cassette domain-containing protein n=1 Tax=Caulobacter radicis TaxID=2172650 RepID=UPI000D585CC9